MTRPPQGASAAGRAQDKTAIVHQHDAPHRPHSVGCPNCHSGAKLYLVERVVIHRKIATASTMTTLSEPALEMDGYHEDADIVAEIDPVLLGVGCSNCRWSYEGDKPLGKLVRL